MKSKKATIDFNPYFLIIVGLILISALGVQLITKTSDKDETVGEWQNSILTAYDEEAKIIHALHSNARSAGRVASFTPRTNGMGNSVKPARVQKTAAHETCSARSPTSEAVTTTPNALPPTMKPWIVPFSSSGVVSSANPSVQVSYSAIPIWRVNASAAKTQ